MKYQSKNVCLFKWIFIYLNVIQITAKLSILMDGIDVTDTQNEPVTLFEGDKVLLTCMSDRSNTTISWVRKYAITVNNTLVIEHVRLADAGIYLCTSAQSETHHLDVEVLYPPSYPVFEGINTGLVGEQVSIKCISDGNPLPTYKWKRANQNGAVLSRNQTYEMIISAENQRVVCIAQSLMVTTLGKSKSAEIARGITITHYIKASIKSIENGPNLKVRKGEDIDILCDTVGHPEPNVWWTKAENKNITFAGKRLIRHDIDRDFAGVYICHARNVVISVNKTAFTSYDTKTIHLKVAEDLVSRTACSSIERESCCERNFTKSVYTKKDKSLASTDMNMLDHNKKEVIIMIIGGIGWTALVISIIINIYFYMYRRRKDTGKDKESCRTRTDESANTSEYTYARSLSETSSSYITDVRFPEGIYLELNSSDILNSGEIGNFNTSALISGRLSTLTSDSTYLKPIFTSSHTSNN